MKGEGDKTGTPRHKPQGRLPEFVGCCASDDPHPAIPVEARDGDMQHNKDARDIDGSVTVVTPVKAQAGIRISKCKQVLGTSAHLKCIYTNAHSMGNKQEELEAMMQQENYDVMAITETWWDVSHDWSVPIDGYKLFRRDRQGRRGGGVALYIRDCYDCFEHKCSEDRVECLCVRISH